MTTAPTVPHSSQFVLPHQGMNLMFHASLNNYWWGGCAQQKKKKNSFQAWACVTVSLQSGITDKHHIAHSVSPKYRLCVLQGKRVMTGPFNPQCNMSLGLCFQSAMYLPWPLKSWWPPGSWWPIPWVLLGCWQQHPVMGWPAWRSSRRRHEAYYFFPQNVQLNGKQGNRVRKWWRLPEQGQTWASLSYF